MSLSKDSWIKREFSRMPRLQIMATTCKTCSLTYFWILRNKRKVTNWVNLNNYYQWYTEVSLCIITTGKRVFQTSWAVWPWLLIMSPQCIIWNRNLPYFSPLHTDNWRGVWNKALSDFWCYVKFSLSFTTEYKEIGKENLVIYQKSLKAFLQAPLQFCSYFFMNSRIKVW